MPKYWVRQAFERQDAGATIRYIAGTKVELPADVGDRLVADGWLDPPKPLDLAQEKARRATAKAKREAAAKAAAEKRATKGRRAPVDKSLKGAPETKGGTKGETT